MGQKALPLNITVPSSPLFLIRVPVLLQDGQFKCDLSPGGGRVARKPKAHAHYTASLLCPMCPGYKWCPECQICELWPKHTICTLHTTIRLAEQVLLAPLGALYFTPPGDPSIHTQSTYRGQTMSDQGRARNSWVHSVSQQIVPKSVTG